MTPETLLQEFAVMGDAPNGVQKLRELILQLAVRGKLVPQDPSDEPVSEDVKNRGPGIPANWSLLQLGDVTEISRGITFPGSAKSASSEGDSVACLRTANVQNEINWGDLIFVPEEYVKREDQWVRPRDVIISMANSLELVGKVALVRDVPQKTSFGGFLSSIRAGREIAPEFLFMLLRSPDMLRAIRSTASRTTNIANISLRGLRPIELSVPPIAEQRRIVAKVGELMSLCDTLETRQQRRADARMRLNRSTLHQLTVASSGAEFAANWQRLRENFHLLYDTPETVAELRELILQLAVRGKLVPQDSSDEPASVLLAHIAGKSERLVGEAKLAKLKPSAGEDGMPFPIPASWQWVPLGRVGDWRSGTTPRRGVARYYGGSIPWLKSGELNDGVVTTSEETITEAALRECSLRVNRPGDVLLAMYGATIGKLGLLEMEATTNQAVCACSCASGVSNHFLFYLLRSLRSAFASQGAGGAQPNISRDKIVRTVVPLPPTAEQHRIVAKVDELMALCGALEVQLTRARKKSAYLAASAVHHLTAA